MLSLSVGVVIGVFVTVLYLASLFLIVHRSVDLKINTLIESGGIERPTVTQKVDPIKKPQLGGGAFAMAQDSPGSSQEIGEGNAEPNARQQISPLAVSDLGGVLAKVNRRSSRALAMKAVIDLWSGTSENSSLLNDMENDQAFFKVAARQNGLLIQRLEGDFDSLLKLNLPAVLEFYLQGGGAPRYLTLAKTNEEDAVLLGGAVEEGIRVDREQLAAYWSRVAYVAWKDFLNLPVTLSPQSSGDSVLTLKMFMYELGYKEVDITPAYDDKTAKVIKQLQRRHGLRADGVVGPLTKIALYNEKAVWNIPRLAD